MPTPSTDDAPPKRSALWRRSTRCSSSGCVEIAVTEVGVHVRDSKNAASPVLSYDRTEWLAFIEGVKAGEFDL